MNVRYLTVCLLGLALFSVAAVGEQEEKMTGAEAEKVGQAIDAVSDADRDAIRAAASAWLQAHQTNDWGAVAAMYTEDAVLMPPNQPEIRGRDDIRTWFEENESGNRIELEYVEIDGCGDVAYVRGKYRMTIPVEGGEPIVDVGKLLEIRRRSADGSWLVARDMFSSDLPLQQ